MLTLAPAVPHSLLILILAQEHELSRGLMIDSDGSGFSPPDSDWEQFLHSSVKVAGMKPVELHRLHSSQYSECKEKNNGKREFSMNSSGERSPPAFIITNKARETVSTSEQRLTSLPRRSLQEGKFLTKRISCNKGKFGLFLPTSVKPVDLSQKKPSGGLLVVSGSS